MNSVEEIINEAVKNMIKSTGNDDKINRLLAKLILYTKIVKTAYYCGS